MRKENRPDLHQMITDQIVAAIENGAGDWKVPWERTSSCTLLPRNAATGKAYTGINTVVMWCVSEMKHYEHGLWATYKTWQSLGAQVRKGEKSTPICFYKEYLTDPDPSDETDEGRRRVLKYSAGFNVAQVDGFDLPAIPPQLPPVERIAHVDSFVAATGAVIEHRGEQAYYSRAHDRIVMPPTHLFKGDTARDRTEAYLSTLLHELTHYSGAPHRLNREFGERFGDNAYAFEELVASLGASFLCADLGIRAAAHPSDCSYIAHWLGILKKDNRAIFTAAAKASEAARYLASFPRAEADHAEAA